MNVNEKCKAFGEQFAAMSYDQQVIALEELRNKIANLPTKWNGEDPYVKLLNRCEKMHNFAKGIVVEEEDAPEFVEPDVEENFMNDGFFDSKEDAGNNDEEVFDETANQGVESEYVARPRLSSRRRRFCAYLLDAFVLPIPMIVFMFLAFSSLFKSMFDAISSFDAGSMDDLMSAALVSMTDVSSSVMLFLMLSMAWSVIMLVITIIFWTKGSSFGKKCLGLCVVHKKDDTVAGFGTMFLRDFLCKMIPCILGSMCTIFIAYAGGFVSLIILLCWYGMILVNRERQAGHDKIMDTIVVHNVNSEYEYDEIESQE